MSSTQRSQSWSNDCVFRFDRFLHLHQMQQQKAAQMRKANPPAPTKIHLSATTQSVSLQSEHDPVFGPKNPPSMHLELAAHHPHDHTALHSEHDVWSVQLCVPSKTRRPAPTPGWPDSSPAHSVPSSTIAMLATTTTSPNPATTLARIANNPSQGVPM